MLQSTHTPQNPFKWVLKILAESILLTAPIIGIIMLFFVKDPPKHLTPQAVAPLIPPQKITTLPTAVTVTILPVVNTVATPPPVQVTRTTAQPVLAKPRIKPHTPARTVSAKADIPIKRANKPAKGQPLKHKKAPDAFKMLEQSLNLTP
ncbi:MAG: hypothetical protein RL122_923 [Pseudomonadota bacterium]|jgi:hypothetical protein|uniref:Uncharacterized protein n=1 Tax=Thiothrix fructosivorans TaxID=111770 RepID=A0A8B0SM90_9GAMM|nr:hypothetical protein [Thiothrix fructosivorans]MBO0612940.1 hypothetical protein [Thiothrix fructosivorans]QTX11610.1 hypothetical protein J1836_004455 [Thiothrix fructosivorans]